jgi:hypothetical protein
MKIAVLDPRNGAYTSELLVVDAHTGATERIPLGYVPEVYFDAAARELVVLETELKQPGGDGPHFWLKCFGADTLRLVRQKEIREPPLYAGLPGRSTRVACTPSGRYLYFLHSQGIIRFPHGEDQFCLTCQRYDRARDVVEPGRMAVESCMLDFVQIGAEEDQLCFHLSCDFPSTVTFGRFGSPELDWVRLEELAPRRHSPQETCGSWLDRPAGVLYCVTGEGKIFAVRPPPQPSGLWFELPLTAPSSVPLHHLYGGGDYLFVGVATSAAERSLSLVSEVWMIGMRDRAVVRVLSLPVSVISFATTADGAALFGTNPYEQVLFAVDTATGSVLSGKNDLGTSPAEVVVVP